MFVKSTVVVCLLCLISISNYAQKNLKEASILLKGKDTAKGYIDYKEWTTSPTYVLFTADKNAPTRRFDVKDVSYFDVAGLEQYQSHTVKVSLDKAAVADLGDRDTSWEVRTVFLKLLITGNNVTLFSYQDKLKTRFYLLEKDGTEPEELLNTTYLFNEQVSAERQYRSTLRSAATKYLPADKAIVSQINDAGYYLDDIAKICFRLNGSTINTNIVIARHKQRGQRFFIGAGINQGSLSVSGVSNYSGINSSPFYFPVVGAGFDWAVKPEVGRIVFRGQLQITGYKTDAYTFRDFTQYTEQYHFKFRQINVAFNPQLLYNVYNQKNLKWFLGAGVGLNFSSYPVNQETFLRTSSTNSGYTNDEYLIGLEKFWLNGCLSTGVTVHRLEFSLAYFPKASITRTTEFGIDNSSLQLRMNLYIIK